MNKAYLMELESELELEDFLLYPTVPHKPVFTNDSQLWGQFVSTTEERQAEMLRVLNPPTEVHGERPSWEKIDPRVKRMMLSAAQGDPLRSINNDVCNFLQSEEKSIILKSEDGFGRLLCHGVCQYYNIKTQSILMNGSRVVRAEKTPQSKQTTSLIHFLQMQNMQ